ncbi:DNA-binding NarL/FixJ family response regulator [Glycomyces algeriensis]|uniref:DNA-binding response regulator n=1 Tax=Glycomyces algeriensis TaxID=256037 RepID=A0A9W6G6N8_9ACTN|nr:response regulator transcription factor [Glycomyces algeriensis]MDA1369081.1 response regulator transcription factor [Glycomyces algeriensis]MDR7348623.1 DNA-binding NarL/FixJ family response regulator [Glycomyces algeriensis]GLI41327.1 DNA-binding response regulator [Glycomyces algeriensis]
MTTPPITILIADDDPLVRTGLRTLLAAQPGIEPVAEASDGARVLPLVRQFRPDVVLMDVRMPDLDGIAATRLLRESLPDPPHVLVITTFENDDYVYEALRSGAGGFVLKRADIGQIALAVRVVASGALLFPEAIRALAAAHAPPPGNAHGPVALTPREAEVLRLVAEGLSNQAIATRLFLGLETVKTHVGSVLTKLGARNRTEAVIMAYESGFVRPGERRLPGPDAASPLCGSPPCGARGRRGSGRRRTASRRGR